MRHLPSDCGFDKISCRLSARSVILAAANNVSIKRASAFSLSVRSLENAIPFWCHRNFVGQKSMSKNPWHGDPGEQFHRLPGGPPSAGCVIRKTSRRQCDPKHLESYRHVPCAVSTISEPLDTGQRRDRPSMQSYSCARKTGCWVALKYRVVELMFHRANLQTTGPVLLSSRPEAQRNPILRRRLQIIDDCTPGDPPAAWRNNRCVALN